MLHGRDTTSAQGGPPQSHFRQLTNARHVASGRVRVPPARTVRGKGEVGF